MLEFYSLFIYLILGFALAYCAENAGKAHKAARTALIWACVLVPALVDQSPRNLAQSGTYVLLLGLEMLAPHQDYTWTSSENLKNASLVAFKRMAFLLLKIYVFTAISHWSTCPWGLNRNGVPFWLQAVVGFLSMDLFQYLCHRGQHRFKFW
jgi:sterol desaturase/sphingolipid hydroxylase (fatty acid hydroxylase superfamily)